LGFNPIWVLIPFREYDFRETGPGIYRGKRFKKSNSVDLEVVSWSKGPGKKRFPRATLGVAKGCRFPERSTGVTEVNGNFKGTLGGTGDTPIGGPKGAREMGK